MKTNGIYTFFDGMTWPFPGEELHDLEYRVRYSVRSESSDHLLAASVINAYAALVQNTQKSRNLICKQLKLAAKRVRHAQN